MDFDQIIPRREFGSLKWNRYSEDVLPLWVADMDFESPDCIKKAISKAAEHNIYGYTLPQRGLIGGVISMLADKYNWDVKASSIVWLPSLVSALNISCRAFKKNSNKVITSTPIYPPFLEAPVISERNLKTIPLLENKRFEMDFEEISTAAQQSSLYLLCNPHNPVGRVYEKDELKKLADICLANNMVICSDEIHCDLVLDKNIKHTPIATLSKEIEQNTVTLMSPGKTYNTPTLGFAFAIIPNYKLRKKFLRVMKGIVPYPGSIGLAIGEAAYKEGEPWRLQLVDYLLENRNFLREYIQKELPKIKYLPGEATYLAWLDIRELKLENPVHYFIKNGVALSDGKEFGAEGFLRLNFGCPRAVLKEALQKIKDAYQAI